MGLKSEPATDLPTFAEWERPPGFNRFVAAGAGQP
jgi:hypothetical protein